MIIATPTQRAEYAEEMVLLWQRTAKTAQIKNDEQSETLEDWKLAARLLANPAILQRIAAMSEEEKSASLSMLGAVKAYNIALELSI